MGFVCIIGVCYAIEMLMIRPHWSAVALHTLVPMLDGKSIYIAVGMLGATVMPHVVYLHSALVQPRGQIEESVSIRGKYAARLRHLRYETIDVFVAMNAAWLVNSAMVIVAAAVFGGHVLANPIEDAHRTLAPLLGEASAFVFALALLCSGLSSSTVGTMAGQVIIEGFLDIKFPIFLRRLITIVPAVAIIATGLDPLKILVLSQVVLSFALPFALVPLLLLTSRPSVMESFASAPRTRIAGWVAVAVIVTLNAVLLGQLALGL
jgi:manganese transport protein